MTETETETAAVTSTVTIATSCPAGAATTKTVTVTATQEGEGGHPAPTSAEPEADNTTVPAQPAVTSPPTLPDADDEPVTSTIYSTVYQDLSEAECVVVYE